MSAITEKTASILKVLIRKEFDKLHNWQYDKANELADAMQQIGCESEAEQMHDDFNL